MGFRSIYRVFLVPVEGLGSYQYKSYDLIFTGKSVPQKIRELVAELERAGFIDRGGKGSHRNFVHPKVSKPITISGALGDDAKHYQIRAVKRGIEESTP